MLDSALLRGRKVAISISASPDYAYLGIRDGHIAYAMAEIARQLMAAGAHLIYGGDLRANGFTEILFEISARHHILNSKSEPAFTNYLPWAVHMLAAPTDLINLRESVSPFGKLVLLSRDGRREVPFEKRLVLGQEDSLSAEEWAESLTGMRRLVAQQTDARIVLGGQIAGFKGEMPGIAEEALLSLKENKPVYVLGGFGGCSADIARCFGLSAFDKIPERNWPGLDFFRNIGLVDCGLDAAQRSHLATSPYLEVIIPYLLRGLSLVGKRTRHNR